jgi:hypothetical protein
MFIGVLTIILFPYSSNHYGIRMEQETHMIDLYPMICKRKSFHVFSKGENLSETELQMVQNHCAELSTLVKDIQTKFKIVPIAETTCRRGEYCILVYSEHKPNYLQNIGYMLAQLDLWLAFCNIGSCWYGMGKSFETKYGELDFVIMMAIAKQDEQSFRKDVSKTRRKPVEHMWQGLERPKIADVIRYAPSACNSQPWNIISEADTLRIYRLTEKRGILPAGKAAYYHQIDIGIFLLYVELCLQHEAISFIRNLYLQEKTQHGYLSAEYRLLQHTMS